MTAAVAPRAVSWRTGNRKGFGAWHVRMPDGRTACGVNLGALRPQSASVKDLRDIKGHVCKSCTAALRRSLVESA